MLALESTGARMNRLGSELLAGMPLDSIDEVVARIDAVTLDDLSALVEELWAPDGCRRPGSVPTRTRFDDALVAVAPAVAEAGRVIKVAVAGAAGKMGADGLWGGPGPPSDMELVARADPALGHLAGARRSNSGRTCSSTSRSRTSALANAREAIAAGVHVVIGTTGFDPGALADFAGAGRMCSWPRTSRSARC